MITFNIHFPWSDFFHKAKYPPAPSMLLQMANFRSFLWMSTISLYKYTHTHTTSFIHSSVDRHLGCFCILLIINNAAMNIAMHVSFWIGVFDSFGYIFWEESLDYMVVIFLALWGTSLLLSPVVALIYIPTNSIQGYFVLNILANVCYL